MGKRIRKPHPASLHSLARVEWDIKEKFNRIKASIESVRKAIPEGGDRGRAGSRETWHNAIANLKLLVFERVGMPISGGSRAKLGYPLFIYH